MTFNGNILFASKNAFKYKGKFALLKKTLLYLDQSRRDDLISLCYLLVFFLNGKLDWLGDLMDSDPNYFEKVGLIKMKLDPEGLCVGKAKLLLPFVTEVFSLSFTEEPPYQKLRFLLMCPLLKLNKKPDSTFDWSTKGLTKPVIEIFPREPSPEVPDEF